jgi:hypothetical protein
MGIVMAAQGAAHAICHGTARTAANAHARPIVQVMADVTTPSALALATKALEGRCVNGARRRVESSEEA